MAPHDGSCRSRGIPSAEADPTRCGGSSGPVGAVVLLPESKEQIERLLLRRRVLADKCHPPPTAGGKRVAKLLGDELVEIVRNQLLGRYASLATRRPVADRVAGGERD